MTGTDDIQVTTINVQNNHSKILKYECFGGNQWMWRKLNMQKSMAFVLVCVGNFPNFRA